MALPESLQYRRHRLGITQSELARRAGTSQSAVAAYESGTKSPSADTMRRLERSLSPLPGQVLTDRKDAVIALLARHRASDIHVFGSVARGEDTFDSDIDLLVDFNEDASVFDAGGLLADLEELLSPYHVDLVSGRGLLPRDEHIRDEARPL
jgi:predicted nucleotidyltransferase